MYLLLTLQRVRHVSTIAHQVAPCEVVRDVPASVATVLDAHVAEHVVEVEDRHVERLGHLRSRQRVLSRLVQHTKCATYNDIGTVDNLFIGELAPLRIFRGDIAARLSDLW